MPRRDPSEPPFLSEPTITLHGQRGLGQPGTSELKIHDGRGYSKFFTAEITDRSMHECVRLDLNPIHLEHLRQWLNRRFEEKPL